MATNFKIGDLVWAKMKGFQAWPGKVVEPKENIKKPSNKKNIHFVYFYGSENYAWIPDDNIYRYPEYKSKYEGSCRIPKGFKEALEAIENEHQAILASVSMEEDLPSIDEEVALMQKSTTADGDNEKSAKKSGRKPKDKDAQPRKSKTVTPTKKGPGKRGVTSQEGSSSTKKFFMSKGTKSPDIEGISKHGDDSMRESYHFTDAMTTDIGSVAKIEEMDDVMSESKASTKTVIPTPLRIGFLGLGIMGQGMVMNLLRSGHEVTVWNRTATRCREFVKAGALKGNNPADVVQSCDITFTCVADSTAVRDIMFGNMGVLDGISKGSVMWKCPLWMRRRCKMWLMLLWLVVGPSLRHLCVEVECQPWKDNYLFCAPGIANCLTICYSCFEAIGKKSFYLGNEVGTATRMKLINNMILGNMVASLSEGMALAEKVGIDLEDFSEVLSLGSLSCRTMNHKSQAILNGRFDPHFPLQHQQKDLRLVLGLGDSVEQPLYLAAAANELFKKARRMGYGEGDVAAVFKAANEFGVDPGESSGYDGSK